MIIKVQDDKLNDRFVVESTTISWRTHHTGHNVVLEVYGAITESESVGSVKKSITAPPASPNQFLNVYHGDRVFVMNNEGKTVDSKHINLQEEVE